jgi:hypothetical protein
MLPVLLCGAGLLQGCGYFGYYKYRPAERATPEEAAQVRFPHSLEGGSRLTGPQMKALQVAMNDYRPPNLRPEKLDPPDSCLARWEYIQTTVLQVSETLFFVEFTPDLRGCGPGYIVLDAGATYALDGQGRILGRE